MNVKIDIEQNLLDAITAYIDDQRGIGRDQAPILTPDSVTISVAANTIRAILTLRLMERGKKVP
jgi:hypothetical protein